MQKPSSKVIALLIICFAIIAVVIYVDSKIKTFPKETGITASENIGDYKTIGLSSDLYQNSDIDSDKDGLSDWEELVWNANPQNPDTDGDGSTDGEEIAAKRDPILKGPNDLLSEQQLQIGENEIAKSYTKNSETDNFSKKFIDGFLAAKEEGILGTESQDTLIQGLANQAIMEGSIPNRYSKEEFTTFQFSEAEARAYGNLMAQIQVKNLITIGQIAKQNDLVGVANAYKSFSKELYPLKVPVELLDVHTQIVNNFYIIGEVYVTLSDYEKDPIKSVIAIKEHKRIEAEQVQLYTRIANYFAKNGIIFDNSESGAFWNRF